MKSKSIIPCSIHPHNSRPVECSTKFLEEIEKKDDFPDKEMFMKELQKRRSRPKCRGIRLARLAAWLEGKQEKAKHNQMYSGDSRKM